MHDHDDDEPPISESYAARQRERDERYQREYAEWISSLPPEERRKVKEMGLDKAYLPSGSGGATKDAAESSRARCEDSHEEPEEPGTWKNPPQLSRFQAIRSLRTLKVFTICCADLWARWSARATLAFPSTVSPWSPVLSMTATR
jgi:cobalamin biosynthesis Mg chelatase CobN